jgi:hypothetical protein
MATFFVVHVHNNYRKQDKMQWLHYLNQSNADNLNNARREISKLQEHYQFWDCNRSCSVQNTYIKNLLSCVPSLFSNNTSVFLAFTVSPTEHVLTVLPNLCKGNEISSYFYIQMIV